MSLRAAYHPPSDSSKCAIDVEALRMITILKTVAVYVSDQKEAVRFYRAEAQV